MMIILGWGTAQLCFEPVCLLGEHRAGANQTRTLVQTVQQRISLGLLSFQLSTAPDSVPLIFRLILRFTECQCFIGVSTVLLLDQPLSASVQKGKSILDMFGIREADLFFLRAMSKGCVAGQGFASCCKLTHQRTCA
jgi:hypothetical protein|uniref:Uncharacterized protein n=1 Tax=Eutreptiella gymnastica TaxID=73025 RepID=A0A6T2FDT1_9EUGL